MTQTYSVAITDGGFGPVDIKTNLTFKEALKKALSYSEPKDIKQFCDLYTISTKDHKAALARIQEIIEKHLNRNNDFYYDNNSNDNTIISIDLRPKPDKYADACIEIGGYDFFAFAKPEDNYQRRTVAIPGSTENLFVETDPTNKDRLIVVQKGETYDNASLIFETEVKGDQLQMTTSDAEAPFCFYQNTLPIKQNESETD